MSQTASFLTDYLFPGLLIGCGCLGLGVVNALAQSVPGGGSAAPGSPDPGARKGQVSAPASRTPAVARPAALRVRPSASPRVAPLRRVVRPRRHYVGFAGGRTRVSDAERERLRIFLAAAQPGAKNVVTVVGHPKGRRGKRRARRRAARVVKLLRELGVVAASLAAPQVASDDSGAGRAVTIVVGSR